MKKFAMITVAALVAATAWGAEPSGPEQIPAAPPGEQVHPGSPAGSIDHFYTHGNANVGQFPGKLVCLRQDLALAAPDVEKCGTNGYVFALSLEGGRVYPLLAATEQANDRIRTPGLLGESVVVDGKYYPNIGIIVTSQVSLQSEKPNVAGTNEAGDAPVDAGEPVESDADLDPDVDLDTGTR